MLFRKNNRLFRKVSRYLEKQLIPAPAPSASFTRSVSLPDISGDTGALPALSYEKMAGTLCSSPAPADIEKFIDDNYAGLSFAARLNLYMHERDITTAMIYKRSFIDRKLISKISSSDNYHPSKQTVFALCIALRLNLKESEAFMGLAGFSFNHSKKYDLIIKFMLDNQVYDIDKINDILFRFHEPCFGD